MSQSGQPLATKGLSRVFVLTVLAGWAALYGPVYVEAFNTLWQTEDQGHGPLVLVVAAWLFWQLKDRLSNDEFQPLPLLGWPLFALGLLTYLLGVVFAFPQFAFVSQLPLAAGLLLLTLGLAGLRSAWFAVFFLVFMVPLPGVLVDASTQSLKQWISVLVTDIMYALDYPVSRTGVTITVGQYQLLVADACSGMHSMFSLSALGTLYMYLKRRSRVLHNAIMLAIILPTAFLANIMRVMILILVTYYFGEEAGRGFLHGFAGLALLAVSLSVLFAVDTLLARVLRPRAQSQHLTGVAA